VFDISPFGFALEWVNPPDRDFCALEIVISRRIAGETPLTLTLTGLSPSYPGSYVFSDLLSETSYTIYLITIDLSGNRSQGTQKTVETASAASLKVFEAAGYALSPSFSAANPERNYYLEVPAAVNSVMLSAAVNSLSGAIIYGGSTGLVIATDKKSATMTLSLTETGEAVAVVQTRTEDALYSATYTLIVKRLGGIGINPGNEIVPVSVAPLPAEGAVLTLSKTGLIKTAIITVMETGGAYSAVSWKVDNETGYKNAVKESGGWAFTLKAEDYGIKDGHELSIQAVRDGIPYLANLLFNVTQ
jgi:Fe2+ transport system protein FeoA